MNIYLGILVLLLFALFIAAFLLRRWKWLSNLSLAAAAVLFVLLIAEFTYRLFFRYKEPVSIMECGSNCYQQDSLLGFKPAVPGNWKIATVATNGDTIVNTRYTVMADTFPAGLKYDHRIAYNAGTQNEAVFIGCSFTFGSSIGDTGTLPYLYGKAHNISTINLGCAAYGLHQVYQLFTSKYSTQDNSNRVFVYSLLSDHFYRASGIYDWNLDGPYYNDSLMYKGRVRANVRMPYLRAPYFLSFFGGISLIYDKLTDIMLRNRMKAFSRAEYERIFGMLRQMATTIQQTGGKLVIVNWDRSNWGYQGYEFQFQSELDKDVNSLPGVTVIPVSSLIDYNDSNNFIRLDGHPTPLANQRIAQKINITR